MTSTLKATFLGAIISLTASVAQAQSAGLTHIFPHSTRLEFPTPSFIQDPLEYATRTHHTSSDTYDRLIPEDLRQAAIVMATMLYNTATREQTLPRMPLPQ